MVASNTPHQKQKFPEMLKYHGAKRKFCKRDTIVAIREASWFLWRRRLQTNSAFFPEQMLITRGHARM
jgi:hypothetical protein